MLVRNEHQALCVAVEMEKRAIHVYERALMLVQDMAVEKGIREILADEQQHLCRFSAMKENTQGDPVEDRMLIQAMGAEVLFPGGVMEMERAQGLTTLRGLYAFAVDSEMDAMHKYADFAEKCDDATIRGTFLTIAGEEATHYAELSQRLAELPEA